MATASKHTTTETVTKEITTYTLTLTEEEVAGIKEEYSGLIGEYSPEYTTMHAIRRALSLATPEPLKKGDRIRITADKAHGAAGDILTVTTGTPDSDGDIWAEDREANAWLIPAEGDDKGWERVA
ncbi:hypothetical protein LHJ74_30830 [Streptomyces sp. N2-109]|uniref:Uncharacterized protein n=1 Tax=Streptomyces gossypii TaxID=2883101 RepID=A0ABT2K260_9ACTN|nr:hypothetical protein [Streptomyces gossypii]MCT2594252.1 hypothetical protein [Streptomyces gossypii]